MKIFLSYGHNDHTKLVDMVFDALRKERHQVWKDNRYEGESGIPGGSERSRGKRSGADAAAEGRRIY